jgi:hypothetical protein
MVDKYDLYVAAGGRIAPMTGRVPVMVNVDLSVKQIEMWPASRRAPGALTLRPPTGP